MIHEEYVKFVICPYEGCEKKIKYLKNFPDHYKKHDDKIFQKQISDITKSLTVHEEKNEGRCHLKIV